MKVIGCCHPNDIWIEKKSENVSSWRGRGTWVVMDIIEHLRIPREDLQFQRNIIVSPKLNQGLLATVANGYVDIGNFEVMMTNSRYRALDFSTPLKFAESIIISKKQPSKITGDFFRNMYDWQSIALTLLSLLIFIPVLWRGLDNHNRRPLQVLCYTVGAGLSQGFPARFVKSYTAKFLAGMFTLIVVVFSAIYTGLVVGNLLVKEPPIQIRTLDDLLRMPELKLIVQKSSYIEETLFSTKRAEQFKHRIESRKISMTDSSSIRKVMNLVDAGTHVLVEDRVNFLTFQHKVRHQFPIDTFYFSEILDSTPGAWIFPKPASELKDKIKTILHWMKDFGIYDFYTNSLSTGMFGVHGKDYDFKSNRSVSCKGYPRDRHRKPFVYRRLTNRILPDIYAEGRLKLQHMKLVFNILICGWFLATVAFIAEWSNFHVIKRKSMQVVETYTV